LLVSDWYIWRSRQASRTTLPELENEKQNRKYTNAQASNDTNINNATPRLW